MANFKVEIEDLRYFQEESIKAVSFLKGRLGYDVAYRDFQIALATRLCYDVTDHTWLPIHRLKAEQMVNIIDDADLPRPGEVQEIVLEYSVLPDGVPGVLNEETIKNKGEIWRVHAHDKDPFPSSPHAHNLQTGYKLHLGNGALYSATNKPLNSAISKKDLEMIRGKIKKIDLPPLIYRNN